MINNKMLIVIGVFAAILAGLYIFIIFARIIQARRSEAEQSYIRAITPGLESLMAAPDSEQEELIQEFVKNVRKSMKKNTYRNALELILLEYMEVLDKESRKRLLSVSYALGLPSLCLSQIGSRNNRNVAYACRKAGLYQYDEAIPHMLKALSILSSDTQFQILMALSRIGDVSAMCQVFDIISRYIIVNERAVSEILDAFTGDKHELYKRMINSEEEYIAALFLKSIDKNLAAVLTQDILEVLNSKGKEARIAAIKSLGKLDKIDSNVSAPSLRKALNDSDWEVRAITAKTLGILIDPNAGEALASALHDREWWVRQNAALSLLAYPNCEKLIVSVIQTGDAYARDSIIYALENSESLDILANLQPILANMNELVKEKRISDPEKLEEDSMPIPK